MDREGLMDRAMERFRERFAKALDALEGAPDGKWIEASEFAFRDEFLELARQCFQESLQEKIDAHPTAQQAAFSPSGPRNSRPAPSAEQGPASGGPSDGHR